VNGLRQIGATVVSLAAVGHGCPDLLVGYHGTNFLLEVKDGARPPSARKLTSDEHKFHSSWRGTVVVVNGVNDAIRFVSVIGTSLLD